MWNIFGGLITKMKVNRKSPGISACKPLFKAHCNNTKLLLSANPDAGGGMKWLRVFDIGEVAMPFVTSQGAH